MHPPRLSVVAAVVWLMAASLMPLAAFARVAVVTTKDRKTLRGEVLTDNDKGVTLNIAGVSTSIDRVNISEVAYELSIIDQFRQKRAAVADDNLEERYKLAQWLFEEKAYEQAFAELTDLSKRFPDEGRVQQLYRVVDARLKMIKAAADQKAEPKPTTPVVPKPGPNVPNVPATAPSEPAGELGPKLTEEQMNLIRVYEIDFDARPEPAVFIEKAVIDEFIKKFSETDADLRGLDNQRRFRTARGSDQLQKFFQLKAREFYSAAEVKTEPPAMIRFKSVVHRPYVLSYCGTNECHGGKQIKGGLALFTDRPASDATTYTNFYILHRFERPSGFMIDRARPYDSFLYQYGLPLTDAKFRHPEVPGWKPRFRALGDPMAQALIDWTGMLYPSRPDYQIQFNPPGFVQPPAAAPVPGRPMPGGTPGRPAVPSESKGSADNAVSSP